MMDRRAFFGTGASLVAAGTVSTLLPAGAAAQTEPGFRLFEVTTTVDLSQPRKTNRLWLPLFETSDSYQQLIGMRWDSKGTVRVDTDPVYGAKVLHATWDPAVAERRLELVQRVATRDRTPGDSRARLTAREHAFWTRSTATLPTDGVVRDTALRIVGDQRDPQAKARAIYDWVVANTWRDAKVAGCGTGDIAAMLGNQNYGGKCVDINSLMVGLCRAADLPARDIYGLRVADSQRFKSLGRSGEVTGAQHCRAEVWLDGQGWLAVDPADVRKAVLEEKLPVNDPKIVALADDLFGGWEGNWAGYNSARDLQLSDAPQEPNFPFLMYPCAMSDDATAVCLDAANFTYRITSREIIA